MTQLNILNNMLEEIFILNRIIVKTICLLILNYVFKQIKFSKRVSFFLVFKSLKNIFFRL